VLCHNERQSNGTFDCVETSNKTKAGHGIITLLQPGKFMREYERWQARFSAPDYAFGKEPNYFLKSCAQLLPRAGLALAIADGEGRNGIWLAEQGLEVLSIDFSPLAQAKARALAAERGVNVNFETVATCTSGNIPKQHSTWWLKSLPSLARRVSAQQNGRACGGR